MNAEINRNGALELRGDNTTELFALIQWKNNNYTKLESINPATLEEGYYKESGIVIIDQYRAG